jgi:hypothetical protein
MMKDTTVLYYTDDCCAVGGGAKAKLLSLGDGCEGRPMIGLYLNESLSTVEAVCGRFATVYSLIPPRVGLSVRTPDAEDGRLSFSGSCGKPSPSAPKEGREGRVVNEDCESLESSFCLDRRGCSSSSSEVVVDILRPVVAN